MIVNGKERGGLNFYRGNIHIFFGLRCGKTKKVLIRRGKLHLFVAWKELARTEEGWLMISKWDLSSKKAVLNESAT